MQKDNFQEAISALTVNYNKQKAELELAQIEWQRWMYRATQVEACLQHLLENPSNKETQRIAKECLKEIRK